MRIAIVNDMLMAVEALRRVLASVSNYELAWIALNGAEAVEKCAKDTPDLILMDLMMPMMDGVEATRRIMAQSPCAILLVTASVGNSASKVFEAMGYGALDAVNTPILGASGNAEGATSLLAKIATIAKLVGKSPRRSTQAMSLPKQRPSVAGVPPLLVMGSSTGGPQALATILSQLPNPLSAAVVIVQHVDAQFASGIVQWLSSQIRLPIALATAGSPLQAGKILLAGTNDHLVLGANLTLNYAKEPTDCSYRPSVDVFFKSVAEHWPSKGVGVLLTGMGRDGAEGLKLLRLAGWHTIAQDQATSVVYGMPKIAVELGAAVDVLPLNIIASACSKHLI